MRNHVVASRGFLDARDVTPIGLQTPPPQSLLREGSPAACRDPIPCGLGPRLGQTVGLGGAPCGCLPGGAIESPPCPAPLYIRGPRRSEACSHGNQKGIEPLFGNRQVIFLQHRNVETNRVPHLANGFFASLPLAHASGQAQALGHPIAVFALENHCLSHLLPSYPKVLDGSRSQGSRRQPVPRLSTAASDPKAARFVRNSRRVQQCRVVRPRWSSSDITSPSGLPHTTERSP